MVTVFSIEFTASNLVRGVITSYLRILVIFLFAPCRFDSHERAKLYAENNNPELYSCR